MKNPTENSFLNRRAVEMIRIKKKALIIKPQSLPNSHSKHVNLHNIGEAS